MNLLKFQDSISWKSIITFTDCRRSALVKLTNRGFGVISFSVAPLQQKSDQLHAKNELLWSESRKDHQYSRVQSRIDIQRINIKLQAHQLFTRFACSCTNNFQISMIFYWGRLLTRRKNMCGLVTVFTYPNKIKYIKYLEVQSIGHKCHIREF